MKKFRNAKCFCGKDIHSLDDGTRLEWVPSWEGVLMYAPIDIVEDRPLRFWHVFKSKRFNGNTIRLELKASLDDLKYSRRGISPRCKFSFIHNGKEMKLFRSHLVMLCITGFAIADRRHWVVDHINNNSLDDRPSNLQVISQKENTNRSLRQQRTLKMNNAERKAFAAKMKAFVDKRRIELKMAMPTASRYEIEFIIQNEKNNL